MSNGVTVDPNGVAGLTFDEAGSSQEAKLRTDSTQRSRGYRKREQLGLGAIPPETKAVT